MKNFLVQVIAGMGLLVSFSQTVSAQWVKVDSGLGDSETITSLAVSGANIFAGTWSGGIFRSTNNGTNWSALDIKSDEIWSLAVSGSTIFAGTMGGGIFLSSNNGASWTAVNSGLTNDTVTSLAVSGNNIFAGTYGKYGGGVFRSTNNGTSWTAVDSGLTNWAQFYFNIRSLAVSGSNIFAGTLGGGIFLSSNIGTSWTGVNSGLWNDTVLSLAVSGNNIFAGTYGGGFRSTNNGTSWTAVDSGLTNIYDSCVGSFAVSGGNIFAGTAGGVFLSTNNGTSWNAVDSGLTNFYVYSLAVCGANLFAGTVFEGVYDAGVWRRPLSEMIPVIYNPRKVTLNQENLRISSPSYNNPNATIEFSIPHSDHVTVAVYNLSGHEIASLVNKNLSQGSHCITWNTRNLAAGCYTVRLQAGANAIIRSVPVFR